MDLNNALALNAKKITINTGEVNKRVSHFQLKVDREKDETNIIFSEAFMKLADVQNNKLNVYYENADECVYFIFHQGNGIQGESLAIDFFKGKKVSLKDAEGNKIESEEIGIKTPRFKDSKTVSGETLRELLAKEYAGLENSLKLTGNFVKYDFDIEQNSNVTSIWTLNLYNYSKAPDTNIKYPTPVCNGVDVDHLSKSEVKQTPTTIVPEIINEGSENSFESVFGNEGRVHQEPNKTGTLEFVDRYVTTSDNTTATAINNFQNSSFTSAQLLEETLTFVD